MILAVKQGANDEALALLSTHESHLPEAPPAWDSSQRLKQAAWLLGHIGIVDIMSDLSKTRWNKLLWNCGMSGISTALGCTFRSVLDSPKAMALIGRIAVEVGQVCKAAGFHFEQLPSYHLSLDQLLKKGTPEAERCLIELFRNSYVDMRNAKAGMLQDLELGRKTEVDWLNGYICCTGRELSVPTPVNDRLVALIHDIEDGKQGLSFAGNLEYLMEH